MSYQTLEADDVRFPNIRGLFIWSNKLMQNGTAGPEALEFKCLLCSSVIPPLARPDILT